MRVTLVQGPEGSPNFCFGLYDEDGESIEFVQTDWELAPLASNLGWVPCEHGCGTDGTVDCKHKKVGQMLSEAFDYLAERDGQEFDLEIN